MNQAASPPPNGPPRLITALPALVGAVLTLVTVLALVLLGWYEHREALRTERERVALLARVLDDHATRSIETVAVAMGFLASDLVHADVFGGAQRADQMLAQAVSVLPNVRSLSLIDANGMVVASSAANDLGLHTDLKRFGVLPEAGKDLLGGFVAGRDLAAMQANAMAPKLSAQVGFIPFLRGVQNNAAQVFYLVALVNPDSYANFQLLTLNNPATAAYLLSYTGEILASSGGAALPLGSVIRDHPVFSQYLPKTEHASYLGVGASAGQQVVAFRLSKTRPLVAVVEHPYADTLAHWFDAVRWFGVAGILIVVFLAFMTWAVQRSLRSREKAHALLGEARLTVVRRERELRVLVKSVQELIFRTDLQGAIIYVNDRWFALRGQSVEQALNQPLVDLVEPEDRLGVTQLFARDRGKGVRTTTANMRSGNGGLRRFDIAVVPLLVDAQLVGFAGSAVDITARFEAEKALQQQLAFVGLLLEISPLPVATFDAQGRYVTVNRAWEDFMGQSRHNVLGQRGSYFMSSADAALHAQQDADLRILGGTLRYEAKVVHRDGTRRDVVVTKVTLPSDGIHGAGVLSTMMDVSEFREAERATREARDAAEESSRAKSEFIANISHELRTPLQSILGFSELGTMRGRENPKLQSMFSEIHASGSRMLALVNNLLDVSKIESAVGSISLERADLRGLVKVVLQELSPLIGQKQLRLDCELGDDALIAKVDPLRFQQVVRNVMANAIKFSPPQSEIVVRGEVVDDDRICISVRDHGVGIPADELEAIFEAFVQSSTTKDGSGGTGLGLAICRKIVDAHGGHIEADNMPEGGAVFRIYLPVRHHLDRDTTF